MPWSKLLLRGLSALLAVSLFGACGDDSSPATTTVPEEVPSAAAVSATVRAVSEQLNAVDESRKVIIAPLYDGTGFGLEVQADVVSTLKADIDVQFIDDATQALVDDGAAVVDGAILLRLALTDVPGPTATITGEYWESADDITPFTSDVHWRAGNWLAQLTFG